MSGNKRLITAALPYANGPLHFGHLAGVYLPADVYYRHSKLLGVESVYICGSDEHGVAITLNADRQKKEYQAYVDEWSKQHQRLFSEYEIEFSHFGRTSSENHKKYARDFFKRIHDSGYLIEKTERQAYSVDDGMFLPDRYLVGTCPKCSYEEARGDECPNCGSWLEADSLKKARSAISGSSNLDWRDVKHWYFDLPRLAPKIQKYLESQTSWKENVRNYALALLKETPERAVTRNLSWGIDLPEAFHEEGKKIYVWFEAPVGYYSNLIEYFENKGEPDGWKDFWNEPSELVHFIGKDNIIFHTIIWPGMLIAAGERLPSDVPANMFVLLQKKQFSKSANWYVDAEEALKDFGIDRLRYYLISIIPEFQDTNFDWTVFREKVNAELVNKIANLFNRVSSQVLKHFDGRIEPSDFAQVKELSAHHKKLHGHLEKVHINDGLSAVVGLTEEANKYLDETKPWNLIKEDKEAVRPVFAEALNYMASIAALLQPFLPGYSSRLLQGLGLEDGAKVYQGSARELLQSEGMQILKSADFKIQRISPEEVQSQLERLGGS